VLRDQAKRKPVETFSSEDFEMFLGLCDPNGSLGLRLAA